jgi:hypothetical protein
MNPQLHIARMPFSEDDLLPYKPIRMEKAAAYYKTLFMQYTMLEPHIIQDGGLVVDVDPPKFANMFELNVDDSHDGFPYAPADFSSVFEQALNDPQSAERRRAAGQNELKSLLMPILRPDGAALMAEVERLIDEELKTTTVSKDMLKKANLRSKVNLKIDRKNKILAANVFTGLISRRLPVETEYLT